MKQTPSLLALAALVTAAILGGCGGGGGSSIATTDSLNNGLIHRWRFDGNANDSVGVLNASAVGPVTYGSAVVGQGVVLNGETTGLNLPMAPDMQFQGSFSISAWASLSSYPSDSKIWSSILFDGDDRPGADPYALQVGPSGDISFQINGATDYVSLTGTMPLNRFVLLTGTYDKASGAMSLYVNGQLVDHQTDTALTPVIALDSTQNPGIGIGTNNDFPNSIYNFGWNGTIDDLRVYNRALTAAEVQRLYSQGQVSP